MLVNVPTLGQINTNFFFFFEKKLFIKKISAGDFIVDRDRVIICHVKRESVGADI